MYDYYEKKGLFNEDAGEEVEIEEEEIIEFERKCENKEGVKIEDEDMPLMVRGELD